MHKSSKSHWGGWSDWVWSEDYQRYYRQRQDTNGKLDTEWHDASTSAADERTPREPDVDALADELSNTHFQDPSAAAYEAQCMASSPSVPHLPLVIYSNSNRANTRRSTRIRH
ncbi:hypothetical protein BKA56DRAFT_90591 [Ilyonectria sp. MPI-CAGE-AT-0026]|nr:hypothetical protein BKA56DRAFT_90591 [Ilyonectria sp. MPI-CAGE-AT-0026]